MNQFDTYVAVTLLFQASKSKNIYQLASNYVSVTLLFKLPITLLFQVSGSKSTYKLACKGYLIVQK